jgi:hypothetical protein
MSSQDPESIVFPPESLHGSSLPHIPHSDGFVFSSRDNQLVSRMEES